MKVTNISGVRLFLKDLKFSPQAQSEGRRGEDQYLEPSGPTQSAYLLDTSEVLRSCFKGDIANYVKNGKLSINDTVALAANPGPGNSTTLTHNFGFMPHVTILKQVGGTWVDATGTVNVSHNAAFTTTTITNTTGFALTFIVRFS